MDVPYISGAVRRLIEMQIWVEMSITNFMMIIHMRDIKDSVVTIESVNMTGEKVDGDWVCESCNYTTRFSNRPDRKDCIIKGDNCNMVCEKCSTVFLANDGRKGLSRDYYKDICGNCNNIINANFEEYWRILNNISQNTPDEVNEGIDLPIAINGSYCLVPHNAGWQYYFNEFQIFSDEESKRELTAKLKRIRDEESALVRKVRQEAQEHANKTKQKCDIMEVSSEQKHVRKEYYFTTTTGDMFPLDVNLETQSSKKIGTIVPQSFWEKLKLYFGKV